MANVSDVFKYESTDYNLLTVIMEYEDVEDVGLYTATLLTAIITDYYHSIGESYISSSIPILVGQAIDMINNKVRQRNEGKGIIRLMIEWYGGQ